MIYPGIKAMVAVVILSSVDSRRNRNRFYEMSIQGVTPKGIKVIMRWGRKGECFSKNKSVCFENYEMFKKYVGKILQRRKRNGYRLEYKSDGFPSFEIMEEFPVEDPQPYQQSLFGTHGSWMDQRSYGMV